jgi:hypothetical protein
MAAKKSDSHLRATPGIWGLAELRRADMSTRQTASMTESRGISNLSVLLLEELGKTGRI